MKQIAQNYKTGELALLEVPVPTCRPGGVLVRSEFSLISSGTERMKVEDANRSLVGKARADNDLCRPNCRGLKNFNFSLHQTTSAWDSNV